MRLYLDTSVLSAYLAEDAPGMAEATRKFFDARDELGDMFVSRIVIGELARTKAPQLRRELLSLLAKFEIAVLPDSRKHEAIELMEAYISAGVLGERWADDALHVAYATLYECDYVVSWNYRHLTNVRREAGFLNVNRTLKQHFNFRIVTPPELLFDE